MKAILSLFVALQFAAFAAPAQEHDHAAMLKAYIEAHSSHGPVIPQDDTVNPAAAKTFNMVARSFSFTVTPSPFLVNQGDVVTINFSVPANDPAAAHGLLMDTYIEGSKAFTVNSGKSHSITFTATTVGTFAFACNVPSCGSGHDNMFGEFIVNAAVVPAPQASAVDPSGGTTAGGTNVTITGNNFQQNATVKFGGVAAANVSVVSATTITATAPAHAAGTVDIQVTNPDAQSVTLAGAFTYALPSPVVNAVSPDNGPTSGNTFITITGSNFKSGATVTIGGLPARNVTVVDANTITAITPLGPANEQLGKKDIVVTNPDGTTATLTAAFQYARPPLAVGLVTPSSSQPAGGARLSITGAGFTNALPISVTIGGVAATNVQVVDAVTIAATAPAHAAGPVDVVVTVGGSSVTVKGAFGYLSTPPRRRATKP